MEPLFCLLANGGEQGQPTPVISHVTSHVTPDKARNMDHESTDQSLGSQIHYVMYMRNMRCEGTTTHC